MRDSRIMEPAYYEILGSSKKYITIGKVILRLSQESNFVFPHNKVR